MRAVTASILLALLVLPALSGATPAPAPKPDRGYWFYEDPPPKPKEEKAAKKAHEATPKPLGPLPPYREMMAMHPRQLRKLFKDRLEEAVWQPTPQNMYAFMLVKDVARRKAAAFTQMHSYMLLERPELNINSVRPVSDFARDSERRAKFAEIARSLTRERNRFGLLYFRSDTCVYCEEQDEALRYFQVRTGWEVLPIDVDRQPQVARKMHVSLTPTVILIKRGSQDYMPVGVGATSSMELEANIFRAVRLLSGTITPQQFFMHEFDEGTLMDPKGDPTATTPPLQEVRYAE